VFSASAYVANQVNICARFSEGQAACEFHDKRRDALALRRIAVLARYRGSSRRSQPRHEFASLHLCSPRSFRRTLRYTNHQA
jgi:hypothetical protein